ncbi:M20 family metallopeptidase [Paenibacillus piri]|uniref:Probable succinyl-diaminopimelate desuccinylase n=1 Tax=Paenibacillus piri TaxID=2547395 RepID=A0A4V2ZSW2_9BACL|nr:M20 family metallopeptidase [Paenibacillus piri]TDF94784.1 M20 family peptidase [Paenibacillus piri]
MQHASPVITALMECISRPSPNPPGEVAVVADWVAGWAEKFGAVVERQTVEPGKDNVIVTLDFGPGPCLVFNTHMDVNDPAGQIWSHPPFQPRLEGGRLYGVGSCDAKGSLVAMLAALEKVADRPAGLRGKLVLTAVMGEEAGGIGSLHLVQQGLKADGAVVGEPTGLEVAIAHKGTYMRKLRFRGKAAHSGRPELGINAIVHAARFIVEYDKLNESLSQHAHPQLGPASSAVTIIKGGTRQNTIPNQTEMIIDRRLIPGQTHEDADRELETILTALKKEIPELEIDPVEIVVATIPSETREAETIVGVALEAAGHVTGIPQQPQGFKAGCDMSKLVTIAGIPTVVLGPGNLEQAHAPDEFVDISQVEQAVLIYERIARQFLGR